MKIQRLVKSRLFGLISGLIGLLVVVSLFRSVLGLWSKRELVEERRAALLIQQKENDRLRSELIEVQTPEFIEKEAREKLGMAREGETIVILPKSQISNPNDQEKQTEPPISNWKKWWRLFF